MLSPPSTSLWARSPAVSWRRASRVSPHSSSSGTTIMLSVRGLAHGQPDLLVVQLGLQVAKHGVIDPLLVAKPQRGGAFPGEQLESKSAVLPVLAHRGVVVRVVLAC